MTAFILQHGWWWFALGWFVLSFIVAIGAGKYLDTGSESENRVDFIDCCGCKGKVEIALEDGSTLVVHTLPFCDEFETVKTNEDAARFYARCLENQPVVPSGSTKGLTLKPKTCIMGTMAQPTRDMLDALVVRFGGATVRLIINVWIQGDADAFAKKLHQKITDEHQLLMLVVVEQQTDEHIEFMVIINTDEPVQSLSQRIGQYITNEWQCSVAMHYDQLDIVEAQQIWTKTIHAAKESWLKHNN